MFNLDDMGNLSIPPLAIQTIIENAVRHGVLAKPEGGTLYISLTREKEFAVLKIKDNGVGMSEEEIQNILKPANKDENGIGVFNANTRLRRQFGTELQIDSEKGVGTTVTIRLPYQKMKYKYKVK